MSTLYGASSAHFQDRFDTRRLADKVEASPFIRRSAMWTRRS